ncbi:MAG: hypothetical protein ACLF0G_03795 [Candidatus Brocadiia bacterium]
MDDARRKAREKMDELKRMAQRVCVLILIADYPRVDIQIEEAKVRQRCQELFPDRMELYEMVYRSRFDRLWEQFREPEEDDEGPPAWW